MKAVILAGGLGTRISEESVSRPKPMIEIGGRPILWHIMKTYAVFGIREFIVCCGYKGYMIKEYFANYSLHMSDISVDLRDGKLEVLQRSAEPWTVTLIDTGEMTATGGRLKRIEKLVAGEDFCFTYGDGLTDLDIGGAVDAHKRSGKLASVTAVQPPGRYGRLRIDGDTVTAFEEKPVGDGAWINGGYFVLSPGVFDLIEGDGTTWEREPMERLSEMGQLRAHRHFGFWQPMDTLRDKMHLEELWRAGEAPWKVW